MARGFGLHIGLARVDPQFHIGEEPAPGCDRAAEAMAGLAARFGYSEPKLLLNEQATRAAVKGAFRNIAAQLAAGDIFFVSVACHGVEHVNALEPDEETDQAFLLHDGKLVDDEVYDLLKEITVPARVVVVAEACYSGTLTRAPPDLPSSALGGARPGGGRQRAPAVFSPQFRRNEPLFRAHAESFGGERPKVTANVLLLAAAADTTIAIGLAPGSEGVPPFTTALLAEVDQASSFRDLHRRISDRAGGSEPFTHPVLNDNLVTDVRILDQRPFAIA